MWQQKFKDKNLAYPPRRKSNWQQETLPDIVSDVVSHKNWCVAINRKYKLGKHTLTEKYHSSHFKKCFRLEAILKHCSADPGSASQTKFYLTSHEKYDIIIMLCNSNQSFITNKLKEILTFV